VRWSPDYRSFGAIDAAVTGAAIAGAGAFLLTSPQNREPRWTGGILFDDGARDALRLSSPRGREAAQEVGTRLYFGALAFPFLDAAGSALAAHRRPEVAAQMALIDTEVFALVGLLNFGLTNVVARQRPFVRSCAAGDDPVFPRCGESGRDYQSFFGGHAAVSFAAAGLTCAHHQNLPLYGGGAPDVLVCAALVANGVAVAWTRMMADKHYFSDNLVGAAIGLSLGYGVPTFFHYRRTQPTPTRGLGVVAVPLVSRAQAGVAVSGAF
jgi:membrane-associated phospholipid phosphatase